MNQLTFKTNRGQTFTWPPTPEHSPTTLSFKVPAGSVLLDFQGRAGQYLDQLQPILLTFAPAEWSKY